METQPALSTSNLQVGYKKQALLTLPDVALQAGRVAALIGKNGVGKSTLLRTLTREQKPVSGRVFIQGEDIENISRRALAQKVAVVTTDRNISPGLLAREIVEMGRHPYTDLTGRLSTTDKRIIEESMQCTGISHKAENRFGELSDGERQKVMIARALAQQTPVMVLDEPFSFLDTAARIEILNLLKKLALENNTAILFSSHDVAQALRMADELWLLTPDRTFYSGRPDNLIENDTINRLFDSSNVKFDPVQRDFITK